MMKNMVEWMQGVCKNQSRIAIPIMTHPGIELCHHRVIDAVTKGEVHFQAIRALNERYPAAATTVIMDLTVEAEAFGATISFPEEEVPSVIGERVSDFESVDKLEIPGMDKGRVPQYLLANQMAATHITGKPVFAGCIGPYSLAGRLFGMTEIMTAIYIEPETITLLLEKCTAFILNYCRALKGVGTNGIVIAEPAAGLLSNEDCMAYSSVWVKKVVDALQDESFMVILHNCGNTGQCTAAMVETGAAGLHFGNKMDMVEALKQSPADRLVMGNIDPVSDFKLSTPAELYQTTRRLLEVTSAWPNFVLSTGCDVPPHVPADNIHAFFAALEDFNTERKK